MLPKNYMSCAQRKTNICIYLLIILLPPFSFIRRMTFFTFAKFIRRLHIPMTALTRGEENKDLHACVIG
jgi:hypothetical protein